MLELARYIVLNPVRAQMVHNPVEWPWSSYRATVGFEASPAGVYEDWILAAFGDDRGKTIDEYKRFVANGKGLPSPWQELKNQIYMGSEQFVTDMQQEIDLAQRLDEFSASQYRPPPMSLDHYSSTAADRDAAILRAYESGGYTLQAIGNHFGLHYSRASRIVSRKKAISDPDPLITRSTFRYGSS